MLFHVTLEAVATHRRCRVTGGPPRQCVGQVGSHLVMVEAGVRVNLSIPLHKELSVGTPRALIRNAGMSVDELLALL